MDDNKSTDRLIDLMERQIALGLHFRGANQDTITRVLQKSKTWVNDLLRDIPKPKR